MADDPGKSYRDKLNSAADKALEVYDRNKRYKPSRETDKHILDRMLENIPGMRPDPDPNISNRSVENLAFGPDKKGRSPLGWAIADYASEMNPEHTFSTPSRWQLQDSDKLRAARQLQKDLDIVNDPDNQTYHTDRKAWDEAVKRLESASNRVKYDAMMRWDPSLPMSAADKQYVQDLENALVADMTAPGAQEDRPGRLQEIKEALDLTNPDSGGRAFLRELKRKMIDDKVPRIQAGHKTQTGEEFMLSKIKELGVSDTPATRGAILANLGVSKLPEKMPLLDDAGNPVPLYVDEMKAAREAAADKAYMQHRRDPMKDTPERD